MVFVYWDNSNICHEAQRLADEKEGTPGARYLVRVHFDNLLRLAHADRPVTRAVTAGSIPPEMRQLWNRMENRGVEVNLFDRGARDQDEQGVPDQSLDDYYDAITFREPSRPGYEFSPPREPAVLDLQDRPMAGGVRTRSGALRLTQAAGMLRCTHGAPQAARGDLASDRGSAPGGGTVGLRPLPRVRRPVA